jgi:hypothetical protein
MLDEIFDAFEHSKRRGHKHDHHQEYDYGRHDDHYDDHRYSRERLDSHPDDYAHDHRREHQVFNPQALLSRVMQNRQLLVILSIAAVVFLIAVIVALVMIVPLLFKFLGVVENHGLRGIIDSLLPAILRIWEGSVSG